MAERKVLMPKLTWDMVNSVNKEAYTDPDGYMEDMMKKFEDREDYMTDFVFKHVDDGNLRGIGFALIIYNTLETASYKQHLKPLPIITKDISVLVEKEIAARQEGDFTYEMIKRIREDDKVLVSIIDDEVNLANSFESVEPALEMYHMLEIAEEDERSEKLANGNLEKN